MVENIIWSYVNKEPASYMQDFDKCGGLLPVGPEQLP